MAAYREHAHGRVTAAAFLVWTLAGCGLVCLVLWRLWTEVLAGLIL